MADYSAFSFSSFKVSHYVQVLIFWTAGFLAGFCFFTLCKPLSVSLMRSAIFQPVSIVGLCLHIFIPFFLVAYSPPSVYLGIIKVCYFIKALSFGFIVASISYLYGSAGWLVSGLYLFSEYCTFPLFLLCSLWPKDVKSDVFRVRSLIVCICLCFIIILFDYYIISPFLRGL